jgi:transglutaminase-like putative cysteine protease
MTRHLLVVTVTFCLLASYAHAQSLGKRYTEEQIRDTPSDFFFDHLGRPEAGYDLNSARLALVAQYRLADDRTRERLWDRAFDIVDNPANDVFHRIHACYLITAFDPEAATPELNHLLYGDLQNRIRAVAAYCLGMIGSPEARRVLDKANAAERDDYVRDALAKAMELLANQDANQSTNRNVAQNANGDASRGANRQPNQDAAPSASRNPNIPQSQVRFYIIRDWIRIRNNGPALPEATFQRYFTTVDDEQLVLGRWLEAHTAGGDPVRVSLTKVEPDPAGNLIHTYRLDGVPEQQEVVVAVSSILARHAKEPLRGVHPIVPAEEYPAEVRPYLAKTPMLPIDDPAVQDAAQKLLAQSHDALEVTQGLCRLLTALPQAYTEPLASHKDMSMPAFVLKYGGSCCMSANAAAAVLRACGIPAQFTYCPSGEIHGITQAYYQGYGWYRFEPHTGIASVPAYMHPWPRVFDLPIEMEQYPNAYLWPYLSSQLSGRYYLSSNGQPCPQLTMTVSHNRDGIIYYPDPVKHTESGSDNQDVGNVPFAGPWLDWDNLRKLANEAILGLQMGEFNTLTDQLPGVDEYITKGLNYKEAAPAK